MDLQMQLPAPEANPSLKKAQLLTELEVHFNVVGTE